VIACLKLCIVVGCDAVQFVDIEVNVYNAG
jgi:hypothetical protein